MLKVHVVSHTHWDREWYMTYEIFRQRLLNLIDELIEKMDEDESFKYFMLDGQSVVIEDYLELRNEKASKLKELINSGRISVGPWYILPDEFLVTGEALIRNFLVGQSVLKKYGLKSLNVGYLPDMFGHNAYTPTILCGLGMRCAVVWRGVGKATRKTEFSWKSPNGESIITINLIRSYSNGAHFGRSADEMKERFKEEIEELKKHATTGNILIMNGTDHEMPLFDLPKKFDSWSKEFGVNIIHSNFEKYIDDVINEKPQLDEVRGELKDPAFEYVLKDVTSTRIYLKLLNFNAQLLFQRYVEPLSVLVNDMELLNDIEYGWKMILKSHPHDSICGCSVDRVHREVSVRLNRAIEVGASVIGKIIDKLTYEESPEVFSVFNPCEYPTNAIVEGIIESDKESGEIIVKDEDGNRYKAYVEPLDHMDLLESIYIPGSNEFLKFAPVLRYFLNSKSPAGTFSRKFSRIKFQAKLPPVSFTSFKIESLDTDLDPVDEDSLSFENAFYKFELNEGDISFTLVDKINETGYRKMNYLEDIADVGDEYNFSYIDEDVPVSSPADVEVDWIKNYDFGKCIRLKGVYNLPERIEGSRKKRSEKLIEVPVSVEYMLYRNLPRIDVTVDIDNGAMDHKLMASFDIPAKLVNIYNDGYFGIVQHRTHLEKNDDATEEVVPRYAMESFLFLNEGKTKLQIVTRGLHEYEVFDMKDNDKISITLLRAVGWLSRDDLKTRKGHAGPEVPTPEAQCIGKYRFKYSIFLLKNGSPEEVYRNAREFLLDPLVIPSAKMKEVDFPMPEIENGIFLSAFKVSEKRDGAILRFFNPALSEKRMVFPIRFILTNMAEEEVSSFSGKSLFVGPGKVVTIKLGNSPNNT